MWTSREVQKLKELYCNNTNIDISIILNKSKSSIDNKGHLLNLKKSKEHLTNVSNIGNNNRIKKGGRDLSYSVLFEIAKQYKTKIEFINNDGPAYSAAIRKGILNDICSHMLPLKFSTPQLILREILDIVLKSNSSYNNRKIIKPYEIDIYYPEFNLGFEYQGEYWHNNTDKDIKKNNLLKERGINIIYIYEISRAYESDIKKQLINLLPSINKLTNKNIISNDINNCFINNVYDRIYSKTELIAIAREYESFVEFKKFELPIYRKLLSLKLVDIATSHMSDKIKRSTLTINELKEIINKYNNLTDFRVNELKNYKHILRLKLDYLLDGLNRKQSFDIKTIGDEIKNFTKKCDFINNNKKMYKYIRKNGLTYMLNHLIDCRTKNF